MTASASTTRPIAVKLEQDIRERIKRLAAARQRSTHWMMREAIQQYSCALRLQSWIALRVTRRPSINLPGGFDPKKLAAPSIAHAAGPSE